MARNLGQKTERRILKKIGARRQPASGAIPGIPNDGVKGRYLLEVKSTQRDGLSLKRKWLEGLEENAIARDKVPALVIIFNQPERTGSSGYSGAVIASWIIDAKVSEWVAIPLRDFDRLSKKWRKS